MEAMKVLVTGGTGTLGSRVVKRLRADGHEARVMSRSRRPGTIKGDLLTGEGAECSIARRAARRSFPCKAFPVRCPALEAPAPQSAA
jgi:nucleoside-diphosphate-sugar epimerase